MPTGHLDKKWIMHKAYRILFLLLITFFIGCEQKPYPPVEILYAYFGRVEINANKTLGIVSTNVIPLHEGQTYGWCIDLRTNKEQVGFTEQLTLAAATTWGMKGDYQYEVSPDKKTIIVKREKPSDKRFICGIWSISGDDPEGKAFFKITIENKVEHRFDFQ